MKWHLDVVYKVLPMSVSEFKTRRPPGCLIIIAEFASYSLTRAVIRWGSALLVGFLVLIKSVAFTHYL